MVFLCFHLVMFLISMMILAAEFFSHIPGVPMAQDLGAGITSLALLKLAQTQWHEWTQSEHSTHRNTLLLRLIGISATLFLWALWISRWLGGWESGWISDPESQSRAYLQAASILSAVVFASIHPLLQVGWSLLEFTPGRKVFALYSVAILAGTAFLIMPWSLAPSHSIALVDAFFITVSALSVTGLAPVDVGRVFSKLGLFTLMVLIQLGGLGIIIISAGLAALTRKRLSLSDSKMGLELYDIPDMGGLGGFLKRVVMITVGFELLGVISNFILLPADTSDRLFHSLFHSVSAFCNAGFSSFPSNLENPITRWIRYPVAALIIVGGIGFPILFEFFDRRIQKARRKAFSPYFVLTVGISIALTFLGAVALFFTETFRPESLLEFWSRVDEAFFYSVSARTAGFNLTPLDRYSIASQFIIVLLMVIGGSPLSTAGGIKTTTAGLILVSVWSFLRGRTWVQFRKREISALTLQKSISLVVIYAFVVSVALLTLILTETQEAWPLTFEVISALSTTGLSLGVTSQLTIFGKLLISVLMLTGRIGLITMILIGLGKAEEQRFRYPVGQFFAG